MIRASTRPSVSFWLSSCPLGRLAVLLALVTGLALHAPPTLAASATPADDPRPSDTTRVHVRVLDAQSLTRSRIRVESGDLRVMLPGGVGPVFRLRPGETASLGLRSGEVTIQRGSDGLYARHLVLEGDDRASWTLLPESGPERTYSGGLRVHPEQNGVRLSLVNAVPLEDYVASVVAGEYGFDDLEGAKAMAVVVRTYALRAAAKFDGRYDHVDHTASQVYKGTSAITGVSRRATQETRGQVLTYDGGLIEAVYFSSSGGHTANNEDVWDASEVLPYLRGKRDPYDGNSPHHRWTTRIDRSRLLDGLSREVDGTVTGFVVHDRSPEGRVRTVDLLRKNQANRRMQANAFRLAVNANVPGARLKSTWFDARRRGSDYVFEGRGFGHGVGLSQWGTHEMSDRGFSYRDILRFYYEGVRIERMDGVQVAPPIEPTVAQDDIPPQDPRPTSRRIGW